MKNMGFGLYSTPMDLFMFYIPFKDKERPAKTKLFWAKPPDSAQCAVLVTFGFSENIRNFSKYHHLDPEFPGNGDFRKSKKFV